MVLDRETTKENPGERRTVLSGTTFTMSQKLPVTIALLFLCAPFSSVAQLAPAPHQQNGGVKITAINPWRGSLAGGTRIHIQGSGFSTNTGEGNLVLIGDIPCDPIPLHCTVHQIACKTRPNLEGAFGWEGWSQNLDVKVIVSGKVSECKIASGCIFSYHYGWYHTPRVYDITPMAVSDGTIITVDGRFHQRPFSFDELNAPAREVPLASVKIANPAGSDQQQPENEPFGPQGTRCALFDPETEEPYGVVEKGSSEVTQFKCRVTGPREAGRYNLSVALLGTNMMPDRDMNMGEAHASFSTYQADHTGASFQVQHAPRIDAVSPSVSGARGGTTVTILGDSFSNDAQKVRVKVGGAECAVVTAEIAKVTCVLADPVAQREGEVVPGARGAHVRVWRDRGNVGFEEFKASAEFNASHMDFVEAGLWEMPVNLQPGSGDASGPWGQVRGFFRAPVASNYTFVVSADDYSEVWVGTEPGNASHLERVLSSTSWSANRQFDRVSWQHGRWYNHETQVQRGVMKFANKKVGMGAGEFRFVEGLWRSVTGNDNFDLGVVMHNSPVNKKDSVFAVDEQQFISVDAVTQLEVHSISVSAASASGAFVVRVGGKDSRRISFKASEEEVRAAIREVLSNCRGANGDAGDTAGNTFDCFMGYGVEYRGLADTLEDTGEKCARWDAFPDSRPDIADPHLALVAGVEGNLCRNPWYSTNGPRCLNHYGHARACRVPRCGGEESGLSPLLATFEEEEEEKPFDFTNVFRWRNGVTPRVDRSTAYCGRGSLYLPNSFGQFRSGWMTDITKAQNNFPFGTKDFPYMCMAYRIPPSTVVSMLVLHDRENEDEDMSGREWKTLSMTNTGVNSRYNEIGKWSIIADDEWHYECIHLDYMMDTAADEGDAHFVKGANHWVRNIIIYTDEQPRSTYADNYFWLDEFSIAKAPRAVEQVELPQLPNGVVAKVASVSRAEDGDTVTWEVALASEDGSPPSAELEVTVVQGEAEEVASARVQEHSPRLEGKVVAGFRGEFASWDPYASDEEVRAALASGISQLGGDVRVYRTGTAQTGYGWVVYMTHIPGDQPEMEASVHLDVGAATTSVSVKTVEDGGLLLGPLAMDYFHQPATSHGVQLIVNEAAASCSSEEACKHTIDAALTPSLSTATEVLSADGEYEITITGSGFSPTEAGAPVTVSVVGFDCVVSSQTATRVVCKISYPFIAAGDHPVDVIVPGKGMAAGSGTFTYTLTVTASSQDADGKVTITGWGFNPVKESNTVTVGGEPCAVLTVAAAELTCQVTPSSVSRRRARNLLQTLSLEIAAGSQQTTSSVTTAASGSVPSIGSVAPTSVSAGGGQQITITGTGFSSIDADNSVLIAGHACSVLTASSTTVTCTTPAGPPGDVTLLLTVSGGGQASTSYSYKLAVDSVAPNVIGLGGGVELAAGGAGFVGGADGTPVLNVEGTEVFVVGLYTAALAHEIHEVTLAGPVVNEVQRVQLTTSSGFFQLTVGGVATTVMPRDVDQYVMQAAINDVMVAGSVRVHKTSQSSTEYLVEFREEQGDVTLLSGKACAGATAGSCSTGGVTVSEVTKGVRPTGSFELALRTGWSTRTVSTTTVKALPATNSTPARNLTYTNSSVLNETQWVRAAVPAAASVAELQQVMQALRPGVPVSIEREASRGGIRWTISFLRYQGAQPLPELDAALLGDSAEASIRRAQIGTELPEGQWRVGLQGVYTPYLPLDASEAAVKAAVEGAFTELHSVAVIAADAVPGRLLDRDYPRQWAIRVSRSDVAGLGVDRCTNPLYVDWDPAACPGTAADLFLSHHPWYWPALLPKPEDLSEASYQAKLQAACDAEARAKNLRPGRCHAPVPLETLPICGQGSGVNPPCWVTRFTKARVTHLDGAEVEYARDDSEQPSDTQKGYRAWVRPALEAELAAQMLQVESTVSQYGAGMHSLRVHTRAAQPVACNASALSDTAASALVPSMVPYLQTYSDLIDSDWLYRPSGTWGHGAFQGSEAAATGVERTYGPMESTGRSAADFAPARASAVRLPYGRAYNGARYTVDLWLLLRSAAKMPIVSAMSAAMAGGYALVIGADARMEHWLAVASGGVAVVSAAAPAAGTWVHVAASFDGRVQRLFVDGSEVNATEVEGNLGVNQDADVVLGGGCPPGFADGCEGASSGWTGFDGALSDVLFYNNSAVSAGAIAGHAAAAKETLLADMQVRLGGSESACAGSCLVTMEGSNTPAIHAVEPTVVWDQATVTVRGRRFTLAAGIEVSIGEHPCVVSTATDTEVVCQLQLNAVGRRHGTVPVSVLVPGFGAAFATSSVGLTSIVQSVTPTAGSLTGGTSLTVAGLGFPSNAASLSVTVGGTGCVVGAVSSTAIECKMDLQEEVSSGTVQPVAVVIAGVEAVCEEGITATAAATPTISDASPSVVRDGTTLTVTGTDLPADEPEVLLGEIPCTVLSHTTTEIQCRVELGAGGVHAVSVRYATGFPRTPLAGCCLQATYAVDVTSVTPANGSEWGGQTVTVFGAGFASAGADNAVFVGGRRSKLVSSAADQLVIETPPKGVVNGTRLGLELEVYNAVVACAVVGTGCNSGLESCYLNQGASLKDPLLVSPASGSGADEQWLMDGDRATVWYSQTAASSQIIAFDLGSAQDVSGIIVLWAGRPSASLISVAASSSTCNALQPVGSMALPASMAEEWDGSSTLTFPTQSARYIEITLTLSPGMEQFRIQDLVILPGSQQSAADVVSVVIGGSKSACVAADCQHTYLAAPTIRDVVPSQGVVGDVINITGSGMNANDCASHAVTIGGAACSPQACTAEWLTCTVGETSAGVYALELVVSGFGRAGGNQVWFTYNLQISTVTPTQGGFGGGLVVTVAGSGFNADPALNAVSLCDAACEVSAASTSQITCTQGAVHDASKAVDSQFFTVAVSSGADDAVEDSDAGTVIPGGASLHFHKFWDYATSLKTVFLRFDAFDVAHNSTIRNARLIVRAGEDRCERQAKIRVRAEAADDSAGFESVRRYSLSSRPVTNAFVDWEIVEEWRWYAESEESVDISAVIQEVVARPGWRAGNALTIVLEQLRVANHVKGCELLSYESSETFAAKLRMDVEAPSAALVDPLACSVSVSSAPVVESDEVDALCEHGKRSLVKPVAAEASASQRPAGPDEMLKEAFDKQEPELLWMDARSWCSRQSSRLCLREEVLDAQTGLPFFGRQTAADASSIIKVPVWRTDSDAAKPYSWIDVSSPVDDYDCGEESCPKMGDVHWHWSSRMSYEENVQSTKLIPCCGYAGHVPYMAADGDVATWWHSGEVSTAWLALDLGQSKAAVSGLEIHWGDGYASEYVVQISDDGQTWTEASVEKHGDGGIDSVSFTTLPTTRHLRIKMDVHGGSEPGYSVAEVVVHGCSLEPEPVTSSVAASNALFTAKASLTPAITSVVPSLGTTAGGSDVTVTGTFFTSTVADLSVSFGDFPCAIQTASASQITCVTSASGILNGGKKYVSVSSAGHGSSAPSADAAFWYIDAWSARTTWGGDAPPAGCGSWVDDQNCTASVVIPAGQVVLLDTDLPRFFLILIEGTLIFDRQDLSMGASYILVRGGTLQIGTESEPFQQQAVITLYGHPKSVELPTFGAKVIACYQCTLDIHGAPQVAWSSLSATANAGATTIHVQDPVSWPVGSKIVIATTDFESPWSSHSEVATVKTVSNGGKQIEIESIGVCSNYSFSGLPLNCRHTASLSYTHLGETRTLAGREIEFRAEVGLLSRNIQIIGDHDARLCPDADTAEDGITKLSCNQFGAQIFIHSPGHESLVARLSNFEIKNGGQAFRLGRYAIHWHMIGNVRESFQRNVSVHHSWNRGTAIHGTNYLRMETNFLYNILGHALFIEDGPEEYNQVVSNLVIKVTPSMSLLNTDQTPACFWIVTGKNYILNNHAVASRRYGIWFRPEISATGTSANTMDVHPINIPILQFRGNQAHSNGKYGLRVFDVYKPNEPSVFEDTFVWRNGAVGWTATVIGRVAFDGMVSVQNGHHVFESRATDVPSWEQSYVTNGLFVDDPGNLHLNPSYAAFTDDFGSFEPMGGPMKAGILLPWNENDLGGMVITNCTFVNFVNPCIRGCAHCGRGGSPVVGDGAFETRFAGMQFINSPERALFRHPNEAFLYDLDGTLTDSGVREDYTRGGTVVGASFVGDSVLLPNDGSCSSTAMSTQGTGGVVCQGHIFRRMWYMIENPSEWVGKALCVRLPHQSTINTCQNLQPECNCLPWLKKAWKGNVWLAAVGQRYNTQIDLLEHELADPQQWKLQVWATYRMEDFYFTQRFLQWDAVDKWGRPLYWTEVGGSDAWPHNYYYNESACSSVGCGQLQHLSGYPHTDYDVMGEYVAGVGFPGEVPIPEQGSSNRLYTVKEDGDENGVLHTLHVRGRWKSDDTLYDHRNMRVEVHRCPKAGCWPPPLPPGGLPMEDFSAWSDARTWENTTAHPANPLNKLETVEVSPGKLEHKVLEPVVWEEALPSEGDDVWIPSWKQVVLDVDTPVLGRVVVEGVLVINSTAVVELSATWIEIKGGSLIIATTDDEGTVLGPFEGSATITLYGTTSKLSAVHGANPRETPEVVLGREGVPFAPAGLGVMGKLVALGTDSAHSVAPLAESAKRGDTEITVDAVVDWAPGSEIVLSPTDFDAHEAEVVRVVSTARWAETTIVTIDSPLEHDHYGGETESYGTREIRMRASVGLLTRNIVIRGTGEGEEASYKAWNSPLPGDAAAAECGNGICQNGETSATCPDCVGPAYEFGATVLVAAYSEDFTYCTREYECTSGYRRSYSGEAQLQNVELRYYGQNNLRPGIMFHNVKDSNSSISHVSLNKGYYRGISVEQSSGVSVSDTVIYRSHLPAVRVLDGSDNVFTDNLAVVSIFWNTHRGATQGKGLARAKTNAMIGMFHDGSGGNTWQNNIAAGSERAGFSGVGVVCGDTTSFVGNEAYSCLAGYWFDHYEVGGECVALTDFTAWKIMEYSVYGELPGTQRVEVHGLKSADARVGVYILMIGVSATAHQLAPQRVLVQDALIVGHSDNAHCDKGLPGLFTCKFYMAWCHHLGLKHRGIMVAQFISGSNMAPLISPWFNAGAYAALYGQMDLDGVTFARFGDRCTSGARAGVVDSALSGLPGGATAADGWHPVTLRNIEKVEVDNEAMVYLDPPSPGWINQADCIDMDCDGPKHALIRDEDGTFIGGYGGAILPRADVFSEGSFFGVPYKDPVNVPDDPWWYPTVPAVMRTNRQGDLLNLTAGALRGGFGLARRGCALEASWNAWRCPEATQPKSYRRLIIENMDADHEIRRPSPLALTSETGYTDLLNGCMDHGWCFSYTCLKRLMTFWAVVTMETQYTVHFTGTNPQQMRLHLPYTPQSESIMIKIYYQQSLRLQIFVGEQKRLVEDMNLFDGRQKAQLVRDGKWTPNDGGSGYIEQLPSLTCPCMIGDQCQDALLCRTPSNEHGANRWNRAEGLLEIVMTGHDIGEYIEIQGMPVVSVSMGVSTSVDEFYNVKDSFISNLASLLGISPNFISIVDVVAGNARRRNLLSAGAIVEFEIEPNPEIAMDATSVSVLESDGFLLVTVTRSINVLGSCSIRYELQNATATAGVNYVKTSGVLTFKSSETSKSINVTLLSEPGYSSVDKTFSVVLSNPVNATLNDDTTFVNIQNVHPPAPTAPVLNGVATSTSVPLMWSFTAWTDPPSASLAEIVGWGLRCRTPETSSAWVDVPVLGTATTSLFGGQPAYTLVQCEVRVQCVGGWSEWSSTSANLRTLAVCGDGTRHPTEECDDGEVEDGDGCSAACAVEVGWACVERAGMADRCSNGCGDGRLDAEEGCDDGANEAGDGCSASCRVEGGWACAPSNASDPQSASACGTRCGDGYRVASVEGCDDNNTASGDGCSAACAVEGGAICNEDAAMLSVCQTCGNGVVEGTEVCDTAVASAACESCAQVRAGWRCSGSPSVCVGGPSPPLAPTLVEASPSSLEVTWAAPDGHGVAVASYTVEFTNSSGLWESTGLTATALTRTNLTAGASYSIRVQACHAEGCSAFGPTASFKTQANSAASTLSGLAGSISETVAGSSAITSLVGAVNMTVTAPPEEPKAPDASSLVGLLNASEVVSDLQDDLINEAAGPPGTSFGIQMSDTAPMVVSEGDGVVLMPVHLVLLEDGSTDHSGSRDVIGVQWELRDSTAVEGQDVSLATGAFAFAPGQASAYLVLTLVDNDVLNYPNPDVSFTVVLTSSTAGSTLLADLERAVTVTDNEGRPVVSLVDSEVTVGQSSELEAALVKSGEVGLGVKVFYSTEDVTAAAGANYVAVRNGFAVIAAGEKNGAAPVTVLQGGGTFKVTLTGVASECVPGSNVFDCEGLVGGAGELLVSISGGGGSGCGNGVRGGGETCDDGNAVNGDGCSNQCQVEPGFKCTPGASGRDSCALADTPTSGNVFVLASTTVGGLTAAEFVGAVRLAFRDGVAGALSLLRTQVLIEAVSRRRAGRGSVQVDYRLVVSEAEGEAAAAALEAAHGDGSLVQALAAQGLNVSVALAASPTLVRAPATPEPPGPVPEDDEGADPQLLVIIACAVAGTFVVCCGCAVLSAKRKGLLGGKGGKVVDAPPEDPEQPAEDPQNRRHSAGATGPTPASIPVSSAPTGTAFMQEGGSGEGGARAEARLGGGEAGGEEPLQEKAAAGTTGSVPVQRARSSSHEIMVQPIYGLLKGMVGEQWPALVSALGEAGMASEYVSEEDFVGAFRSAGVQGPEVKRLWDAEMMSSFPMVFGSELHLVPVAENLARSEVDRRLLMLYRFVRYKGDEVDMRRLERALEGSGMAKSDMAAVMDALKGEGEGKDGAEGSPGAARAAGKVTFVKLHAAVAALLDSPVPARALSSKKLAPVGSAEEDKQLQDFARRAKQPSYRQLGGRREGICAFLVTAAEAAEEQRNEDRKNLPNRVGSGLGSQGKSLGKLSLE